MRNGVVFAFLILALSGAVHAQSSVVILTSDNAADYAVARVWAEKIGADLVVTPWGSMTSEAVSEVVFSQATIVYVVGGAVAIPNAEGELTGYDKTVIRVGGANRQETSLSIAEKFGATRAVVLDGYDTAAMEEAVTLGIAESTPIIFLHRDDSGFGTTLRRVGIGDVTLISNPSITEEVKDSIRTAGIKFTEPFKDKRRSAQKMIDLAESRINETEDLVISIKDGPTLAAAKLLVESKIMVSQAQGAFTDGNYKDAFIQAAVSEEFVTYASLIYNGRYPGSILDAVASANADISSVGVSGAKDALRDRGAPYGVGLPVPQTIDLATYMVDIPGYTKSDVHEGIEYDMTAKYTKGYDRSVRVELYKRADESDAIKWVEQIVFTPGMASEDWESTTFMGYPTNMKQINYPGTDKINQEIYLRVAVGNLGVFTKFTQSVNSREPHLLIPQEEAQAMVDEVTAEIIKSIESAQ
jgi:putative cell wall-binding protein